MNTRWITWLNSPKPYVKHNLNNIATRRNLAFFFCKKSSFMHLVCYTVSLEARMWRKQKLMFQCHENVGGSTNDSSRPAPNLNYKHVIFFTEFTQFMQWLKSQKKSRNTSPYVKIAVILWFNHISLDICETRM